MENPRGENSTASEIKKESSRLEAIQMLTPLIVLEKKSGRLIIDVPETKQHCSKDIS